MCGAPHKFVKQLSALTLAGTVLLTSALAVSQPELPEGYQGPFSDVAQENWFYPYVSALNSQGIIAGYPDGSFGPYDAVSTGAALVMVLKAAGVTEQSAPQDAHWAAGYAQYALDQGWLAQEQIEQLDGDMSRLQIAQLAAQALGLTRVEGEDTSPFFDVSDGYVTALYQRGVVAGSVTGDGVPVFYPQNAITRAEISAILWQVEQYATHIHFGKHSLDILPQVPACSYDRNAFVLDGDRMGYTGQTVQADVGIDVSYYQKEIDWNKVAADGIDFAIIRVGGRYYGKTSGTLYEDKLYRQNIQGALDAGLEVGVYFFSQAISQAEAQEEADFVLNLIKDYDLTGPVVFDWENISKEPARTDGLDAKTLTAAANTFCQAVEKAGYQPMVYFNQHIGYLLYDLQGIVQYPFWLAEYQPKPAFYYDFDMWQYTSSGGVDGIEGNVDMNIRLRPW